MRLELTGRHVDITPALRRLVETKIGKLERVLNDSAVSAQAVLTREKYRHRTDITVHTRGEKFLHGVGDSSSWEQSLTAAIGKISQQFQKIKGKWQGRKREGSARAAAPLPELREAVAVRPVGRPQMDLRVGDQHASSGRPRARLSYALRASGPRSAPSAKGVYVQAIRR